MLELSEQELVAVFGSPAPSVEDWRRSLEERQRVWDVVDSQSGRFAVLSGDSGRSWVAFWGISGD